MALTDNGNEGMVMPVAPMNYNNGGFGFGNDGAWWFILLILFGMGGFGGYGMNGYGSLGGMMYPWMNQADITTNGFQNQALNTSISSLHNAVTSSFGDVQLGIAGVNQNICQTGNGIVNALNSGFANAETAANARQMADMQQNYGAQIATLQGFNNIAQAIANSQANFDRNCCDMKAANTANYADLKYTVATENCADRAALSDGIRDVIANSTANTTAMLNTINGGIQSIKDQICQDKIDAKNELIQNLRDQLTFANLQASQGQQTAAILAGQAQRAGEVEQYVNPTPRPAYIVQNPSCCQQYSVTPSCGYGLA